MFLQALKNEALMRYWFWKRFSTLCEQYAYSLGERILKKFGTLDRQSSLTGKEIGATNNIKDPAQYYATHTKRAEVNFKPGPITEWNGMRRESFTFQSGFVSFYEKNDEVPAVLYRGNPASSSIVIWIGGFFESFNKYEHRIVQWFAAKGFNVCVIALPYHGSRSCFGRSGVGWAASDPAVPNESFTQTVIDVFRLRSILSGHFGFRTFNLVGISIGGIVAHISTFLSEYKKTVLIISGASLVDIFWNAPAGYLALIKKETEKQWTYNDVCDLWLMSDGTRFEIKPHCSQFMMISGIFDKLVKLPYAEALYNSLPNCELVWYPANHYTAVFFTKPAFEKKVIPFLKGAPSLPSPWWSQIGKQI